MLQTDVLQKIQPKSFPVTAALPPWVDIIAFSSTRWEDTYSRPRDLMIRCARSRRVFFFEEPLFDAPDDDYVEIVGRNDVNVVIPHLRNSCSSIEQTMAKLVGLLLSLAEIHQYVFWYFCPFPVRYTSAFQPKCSIYDCINEPSWLRNAASAQFEECERRLRFSAELIFTADLSLYLATSPFRDNVFLFADSASPKPADWDQLWKKMNMLICRTLAGVPKNRSLLS